MKVDEYLPIGSIVILKHGGKKLMIFGIMQSDQSEPDQSESDQSESEQNSQEYDYIAVPYPEGNMGQDYQYLFNAEDIDQIVSRGFEDDERNQFLSKLDAYLKKLDAHLKKQ